MAQTTLTWRDRKRYLWPVALLMPLLPFIAVAGFAATGRSSGGSRHGSPIMA